MKRITGVVRSMLLLIVVAIVLHSSGIVMAQELKFTPNDSLFTQQQRLFDKLNVLEAWKLTKGNPDILIGVIDNGFDFYHPDLTGQITPGYYASGGYHTEVIENNGHGTLVSSIIAARDNNEIGMAGLAPGCRILASSHGLIEHYVMKLRSEYMLDHPDADLIEGMQVLSQHQEEVQQFSEKWTKYIATSIADAIRYSVDNGVRVINISGYLDKDSIISIEARNDLDNAFSYAAEHDVIIVLSAGNDGKGVVSYPGDEKLTIIAGACLLNDERWEEQVSMGGFNIKQGSNYGPRLTVMAPVDDLIVCFPHDIRFYSSDAGPMGAINDEFTGMYEIMPNGATSSAAPIVSSLVGLIYSLRPDIGAESVVEIIKSGCDDIGEEGYDIYTGYGRVNFGKTLEIAQNWQ